MASRIVKRVLESPPRKVVRGIRDFSPGVLALAKNRMKKARLVYLLQALE